MKAITLKPGTTEVSLDEVDVPDITGKNQIKMKVLQVGICGTDREEADGGRADAPIGKKKLIIGHEMFGEVVAVGENVNKVKKGDFGVFSVRRGCGKCIACANNRSDMCLTGDYTERGIKEADGFQAEFVVDEEQYFIQVPKKIKDYGVLTEPMSVASKAIDEALIIQRARFQDFEQNDDWLNGKTALVAGIGAIGILAAFALRLRGAEVYGLDVVDENSLRPQVLKAIGGKYINGKMVKTMNLDDKFGEFDFIFEAVGLAELQLELIDALGINGIYVATGIAGGNRISNIGAAEIMRQMVLKNQVVVGSVNASPAHYKIAVNDILESYKKWPQEMKKLITTKMKASDFYNALHQHAPDEIKVVIDWENSEF